ncbi:MAG: hypothetical protein H6601_05175 [Flavobacteriales bacterium]|nr:hypothetical protein [Flavobacteriales bacterium]
MLRIKTCAFLLLFIAAQHVFGQKKAEPVVKSSTDTTETVVKKKKHSPFRATIMSAALPGLGQVYNGKWWKVPIIYGGFGGLIYSSVFNDLKCRTYRDAYLIRIDDDPNTTDQFEGRYSDANLRELVDFYQRNRDLSLIFTGVLYALNIIDASVDAHLKDFDVSDDLTLKVRPTMQPVGPAMMPTPAVALTLRLR